MATAESPFRAGGWVGPEGPRWLHSCFVTVGMAGRLVSLGTASGSGDLMDSTATVVRNPVLYT